MLKFDPTTWQTWYDDKSGHRRILNVRAPYPDRGGLMKWSAVNPVIPRSQWKALDRRKTMPWFMDQDGAGSCVGNGATGGLRRARLLAGQTDVELSPGCLYAQINGGRDNGAVISDALTALQQTGTCTYATNGEKPYYTNQLPQNWQQEAARFKIQQAYHAESFDDIVSGLLLGFIPVYGIMVGNNFENFTSEGVAGASNGPGNHCMHADGLVQLASGQFGLDNVNSWGAWGPWKNGRCVLVEQHFLGGDQPDAFLIQATINDPQDPDQPPVAA